TYTYENAGTFTVGVDITSPIGCQTDTTFNDLITVLPSPVAGFSYTPERPSNLCPEVRFLDESQGAISWSWSFGNNQGSSLPSPTHVFPDTGLYEVRQIVRHPSGCQDTALAVIDVFPEVRYYLPNAFTPNGDGTNDEYRGKGLLPGATNFQLTIWNRWGERLFRTDDPFAGWNGRKNNVGREAPPGVYLVIVTFRGPRGEPYELKGQATLIR
ncbi:MAG: gliding motility-associated C-terminal domain-containing protein, partial [Lewinella sp.]|nr:gliding motility-associated C-terminal domain-containing protein [Lewinella sp.]